MKQEDDDTAEIMEHVCGIIAQTPNISVKEALALMPEIEEKTVKKAMSKAKKQHQAYILELRRGYTRDQRMRRFQVGDDSSIDRRETSTSGMQWTAD